MIKHELIPTKRAIIDLLRACPLKCKFCYHRFTTWDAPQGKADYWSLSWEQVIQELDNARIRGNTSVDFTGGEPTIWKDKNNNKNICDIIKYAESIGLHTCIITSGFSDIEIYYELISAGCTEFLLSTHNVNNILDSISQREGHWDKLNNLIKIFNDYNIMWRANACININNYETLPIIADYCVKNKCKVLNFININPPYEVDLPHLKVLQVPVSKSAPYLKQAIDYCYDNNLFVNVRYYPMCALQDENKPTFYERFVCNHQQVIWDSFEWDYSFYPKDVETYKKKAFDMFTMKSNKGWE
jgi:MoaA/NifB/PqqE/SkfB family radical SAM enzyme